jgi:hypothetical protein
MIRCSTVFVSDGRCVTNVLPKNWCGPVFIFLLEIVPVISVMHIRLDRYAFIACRRLQRYIGETVRYILSTDPPAKSSGVCEWRPAFMPLQHAGPDGVKSRRDPIRDIALNRHKLAILLRQRVITNSLVHYGMGAR